MRSLTFLAFVFCMFTAPFRAEAQDMVLGTFDDQGSSVASFCYFSGCPTGAWSGSNGGGLARTGSPDWQNPQASSPPIAAIIQRWGSVYRSFTVDQGGRYRITARVSGRNPADGADGNQTVTVIVNGATVGTWSTTSGASYATNSSSAFTLNAGQTVSLSLAGSVGTDSTAFVDDVMLVAVPPPPPSTTELGTFDTQGNSVTNYCYFPNCPSGEWSGSNGGGLVRAGNPAWQYPQASSPQTAAIIQRWGSVYRSFTVSQSGQYQITARLSGRATFDGADGNQIVVVMINGATINTWSTTSGAGYALNSSSPVTLSAGQTITLTLAGNVGTDSTAFVDDVMLVALTPTTPPASNVIQTYKYDALGRLQKVSIANGANNGVTSEFQYDAAGNRSLYKITKP